MQQLLSACSTLQGTQTDDKKSRRTLFVSEAYIDAPMPKRRRSDGDEGYTPHTSPPKPVNHNNNTVFNDDPQDKELVGVKQGSPEQKILLERKKQKKLLEEQKNFQLEDERWTRMEHELDKAFSKPGPNTSKPENCNIFDKFGHPSVGIQASLIADVSPLKPLSHYVQNIQLPDAILNSIGSQDMINKTTSARTIEHSPLVSKSVNESSSSGIAATTSELSNGNVKLMPLSSVNLPSIWKMSTVSSLQTTQPSLYFTMPQQQIMPIKPSVLANQQQSSTGIMSAIQPSGEGTSYGNIIQSSGGPIQPSTVTLPLNIVSSLSAKGLIRKAMPCAKDATTATPVISIKSPQDFTPRMTLAQVHNVGGVQPLMATPNQITPILPKAMPQQLFSPMSSGTPGSNTTLLHSDIAKKLVMPESKLTQN